MKSCPVCGKEYSDTSKLCPIDASVLQMTDDPLLGQNLAGKYRIERLISHGGMGSVYEGKHVLMDKRVAIKVLRTSLAIDNDVVARFSREAKAASRISHPNAVTVTDFGEDENGVVFLVMEYLDGRTLKSIIKSEGPMALNRAVEIVRQVAGALDAAHQQGVVHRDLKSDNIMLSNTHGDDWAKVLDFGIAKITEPDGGRDIDITAPNLVIGTPQYMSPEQCSQSSKIDARSDVYSLGVIVYEMLAGRVPFTGESPTVIMMKQVQHDPPSNRDARPELPAGIEKAIKRALAKQPVDRFQTAGDLAQALSNASSEAPAADAVPATVANEPVSSMEDDLDEITVARPVPDDEVTVVQPRHEPLSYDEPMMEQSALARVNPWRIMVPAAVVLIAVFGIVFLLTRGTGQTPSPNVNLNQPGLVADPNGQPVQPTGTPTGEGERSIQSQPSATPTPRNANLNPVQEVTPSSITGNFGANDNSNTRNRNANQRESPVPKASPKPEEETPPPPPKPTPTVRSIPKSTPSPLS
jgi:serine/threonine protein kinase